MASKLIFLVLSAIVAVAHSQYTTCPPLPQPPIPGCCPPPGAPPPPPGSPPPPSYCTGTSATTTMAPTTTTKAPTTAAPTTTVAGQTTTAPSSITTTTSSSGGTSAIATKVKALIDAGTCASVVKLSYCGSASQAYAYYETFAYKTFRVVIISGVPSHNAEYGQTQPNPNVRCVRYQYVTLPLTPTKGITFSTTPMGATAFFYTGAVMYNPLSSPQGALASNNEWVSLDPCYGHSSPDMQYHYHAISGTCLPGANTPSARALLGYNLDGFPVYGYAQNGSGVTLKSCWTTTANPPTYIGNFTYNDAAFAAGTCHLDKANGYTFSDGYGYVTVAEKYYVPYMYSGTTWARICGFTV